MTKQVRVRMLKIVRCHDPALWYAGQVGGYVPCLGLAHGQWRSKESDGYTNFIDEENARVVHVFVSPDKLGEYPYKYAQVERPAKKPQPMTGQARTPTPWPPRCAHSCKARCDMLGVCRDLPDCEEALGRARGANPKPPTAAPAMGQSHRASAIEAAINIVLGFGISVGITAVLFPNITLVENIGITSVFTVASFARSYGLRRLFNWLHCRAAT